MFNLPSTRRGKMIDAAESPARKLTIYPVSGLSRER